MRIKALGNVTEQCEDSGSLCCVRYVSRQFPLWDEEYKDTRISIRQ